MRRVVFVLRHAMAKDECLTNDEVYDLLHQARIMFTARGVQTVEAQQIVALMLKDIDMIQMAFVLMQAKKAGELTERP